MKTTIIAEAGVNHNADMQVARELIRVAAESGADYVKFQTYTADLLASDTAELAPYQDLHEITQPKSQRKLLKEYELSIADHYRLIEYSKEFGIEFFSTAFDIPSLRFLKSLGFDTFKVPSGELTNYPYLQEVGSFKSKILLSSGMATIGEVGSAIKVLLENGTQLSDITVLHCTSSYPAPIEDVNLLAMLTIHRELGVNIGYSDHTLGTEIAVAAVALGAKVIEKHFTLDRNMKGPDHKASLEPHELNSLVRSIRNIEKGLGSGVKDIQESELENIFVVRKSIVAAKPICYGEELNDQNLTTMRPGTGISAMRWREVLGTKATRDYDAGEKIEL